MKLKKLALLMIITLMITIGMTSLNRAYAATGSMYLKVEMLRNSGYGYRALEKNIWKICETNSSGTTTDYSKTIYCLKGGPGFGSSNFGSGTTEVTQYTRFFDMKDTSSIISPYSDALPGLNSTTYKSLLWLLENVYVAPKETASTIEKNKAAEFRQMLLKNAGIEGGYITDDDIDAVQQLAVWHFTNDDAYHIEDGGTFELHINSIKDSDGNYKPLSDEIGDGAINGWDRAEECQALYDYLVNTATLMGSTYTPVVDAEPYRLTNLSQTITTSGDNYIIGPFKIENVRNNTTATFNGIIKNGTTTIDIPTLQDMNGNRFDSLEDTIGEEFFIVLPKTTELGTISVAINGSYFKTTLTYWSVNEAPKDEQPVVLVERNQYTYSGLEEFTPELKEFDLALRKFIVSINGQAVESREPTVDVKPLLNKGTTATYTHSKVPVLVKTGDKVVYKIRVYNEGEIDGYVNEIIDYLPEGLKLAESSTINSNNGWETFISPKGKNAVKTSKTISTKLNAFNGTTLDYEDVEIECEVIATAESNMSLRNVAEISKDNNEENIEDRDSVPNNVEEHFETLLEDDEDYEMLELKAAEKKFDLALRKYIISINEVEIPRTPNINVTPLKEGGSTTATKNHPKNALVVKKGDKVVYRIAVYNEGEVDGYATKITDYLPEGLIVTSSEMNNKWSNESGDGRTYVTEALSKTLLKAYDGGEKLSSAYVDIECEVTAETKQSDNLLRNVAEISEDKNEENIKDRDSTPNNVKEHFENLTEDDEDYEQLIIPGEYFDLSLRKFIESVNDVALTDAEGKYIREPVVDVKPLVNEKSTATYTHPKEAVRVEAGDFVTYVIRVYNEGQISGYVNQITDHLPKYLEFVNDEFNASYGWKISSDERKATTTITSLDTEYSASRDIIYADRGEKGTLLDGFTSSKTELDYIDVKIKCKVKDTAIATKITNIAEITKASDVNGNSVSDRDSEVANVKLPSDENLPEYKELEIERGDKYIPGQQDDDDFEKVIIQKFDLSLRKFITGVNDKSIGNRVPIFSMDENKNYTYTHPKTPVEVANGDIVIYTLRIFNEGNQAGYAAEVKDDLPEGLEFIPENDLNKEYRWKMYKEDGTETTNIKEAKTIRTDYLSKQQSDETGRENLINAFNKVTMTMPDFKDVKIAFKVAEPNTSDRILINTAEISEDSDENGDPAEDIDSTPDNNEDKEDDIDFEKVKVKYFDLSLKKIITEVSMKLDGKTTITKTGHTFEQVPEPVVKVELGNKKINKSVIKFKYQIRVTNEGEIAGYVKEVKDYIPTGLKFVKADNPKWTQSENGKTVTTDQLKDTLLQPGENAAVEITLQWINGQNNLGIKKNIAEISQDYNKQDDTDDIDSTPDNYKDGEDDIDDASVVLTIVTGIGENYMLIIGLVLTILTAGIILIKKFVI